MRKTYQLNKSKEINVGSSLILMIMMISFLVIIGSTLLFMVVTFQKLNRIYLASEELYYFADKVNQQINYKLEGAIKDTLDNIEIFSPDYSQISDNTLNLIYNYMNINYQSYMVSECNISATDSTEGRKKINSKLMGFMSSLPDESERAKFVKALYDVTFKLQVETNGILQQENALKKDSLAADGFTPENGITSVILAELLPEPIPAPPYKIKPFDGTNHGITISKEMPSEFDDWLKDILKDGAVYQSYFAYTSSNINLSEKYEKLRYKITTENTKVGFQKTLNAVYEVSSNAFTDWDVASKESSTVSSLKNDKLVKAIATTENIEFTGDEDVSINGDIYSYGTMPTNMLAPITKEEDYGGVRFKGKNNNITITGDVTTRGYVLINENAVSTDIDIGGRVICDTLNIDKKATGSTLKVQGDVETFDDIRLSGSDSSIWIQGSYYGLNQGDTIGINKSSAILLNDISSKIKIDGETLIGGLAYVGTITQDITEGAVTKTVAFRTGESTSIGDNYKLYGYRINPNGFTTPYEYVVNNATEFADWLVDGITSMSLFSPIVDESTGRTDREYKKAHFYYYVDKQNNDADGKIVYNFTPNNTGIILNKNKKHYAPGIVSAQMYDGDVYKNAAPDDPLIGGVSGKYYVLYNAYPWGGGAIPAGFDELNVSAENTDGKPYTSDQYKRKIKEIDPTDPNPPTPLKPQAITEINLLKVYDDAANRFDTLPNRSPEFTDAYGILTNNNNPNYERISQGTDIYTVICNTPNKVINISQNSPIAGAININWNDIGTRKVLIYGRGNINLVAGSSNARLEGIVMSIGGNINIDTSNGKLDIVYDDTPITADDDEAKANRKFFAPGNTVKETANTADVYKNQSQNIRLIDKRLSKN